MSSYSSSPNFKNGFPTPGPQNPTSRDVMNHLFFASNTEWKEIREERDFDYIVIGSGFCALAFVERIYSSNPFARILILEKGEFFLPEHFQNLPLTFKSTLGGLSETFPWTLSRKTATSNDIQFQFGIVPFFGGRSTVWSGWCPRPTEKEMKDWPKEVISVCEQYYPSAEKLLNVVPADEIKSINKDKPVYGKLQEAIQKRLEEGIHKVKGLTRIIPAPMAVKAPDQDDIDFSKFSTPGALLELYQKQKLLEVAGKGASLSIATNCTVRKIVQEDGLATALDTSRGIVSVGEAKIVLAMGTLPTTTLVRNSFPGMKNIGKRFTSHFISSVIARVHKSHFGFDEHSLADLELGACYIAGVDEKLDHGGQFHIQLTSIHDHNPEKNAVKALRNMPDVVATASLEQLISSKDYVVFVCAVLGELDWKNENNWFLGNATEDITVNSTLQVLANENDFSVWQSMDRATFETLESVISPSGAGSVEYWHNSTGTWQSNRPTLKEFRVPGLVHDASTMWIGKKDSVVGLDYRPHGVDNVYITGGALWPTGASWNPTLTMVALSQHLADTLQNKVNEKA